MFAAVTVSAALVDLCRSRRWLLTEMARARTAHVSRCYAAYPFGSGGERGEVDHDGVPNMRVRGRAVCALTLLAAVVGAYEAYAGFAERMAANAIASLQLQEVRRRSTDGTCRLAIAQLPSDRHDGASVLRHRFHSPQLSKSFMRGKPAGSSLPDHVRCATASRNGESEAARRRDPNDER